MTPREAVVQPEHARAALLERLQAAAVVLAPRHVTETRVAELLDTMVRSVRASDEWERYWLLFVAISGVFPTAGEVQDLRRDLSLRTEATAIVGSLESTLGAASMPGASLRRLEVLTNQLLIDVDFCARFEHNTGIQRVVRQTLPVWQEEGREFTLVAWTDDATGLRRLTDQEVDRVLRWNDRQFPFGGPQPQPADMGQRLVVPWNSRVFLPEVPSILVCSRLAGIAEYSGNRVSAIGYDAIPLVSAEGQSDAESERFARYLTVLKHSDRVVGISQSAAGEFRGFVDTLPAQGLTGPIVTSVPLAVEVPKTAKAMMKSSAGSLPLILSVGSHEPRKNQEAVLFAAQQLHREGLEFELVFVGGGNTSVLRNFDRRIAQLNKSGAHVSSHRRLGDAELWGLFRRARFSTFISLHEGFGLPVAESLALGTPVITSDFGSLAEIARGGGCVIVDPRDDVAIVDAFRLMLTDDSLIERLVDEANRLVPRTWRMYADELWDDAILVGQGS